MAIQLINTQRRLPSSGQVNSHLKSGGCAHTVQAQDLTVVVPVPSEEGLSMVLKLK